KEEKKTAKEKKEKKEEKTKPPEEKKAEKKPEPPRGLVYALPSHYGSTGVLMMSTAHKQPRGRGALVMNRTYFDQFEDADGNAVGNPKKQSFALAWGIDDDLELSLYQSAKDPIGISGAASAAGAGARTTSYSVKYQFRKKYLFAGDTRKNVLYAAEASRVVRENSQNTTRLAAMFTYHQDKYAAHLGAYRLSGGGYTGGPIGLLAGLETPIAIKKFSFVAQYDLYRRIEFYSAGARYQFASYGTFEAALLGLRNERALSLTASFLF
ncbi:MAG: hypothetical protein AB1742_13770, partial [bacterium]